MEYKTNLKYLPENLRGKIVELKIPDSVEIVQTETSYISVIKNGIRIYSKYKPLEEVKKSVHKFNIANEQIIILLGFGLGYHLKEIVENFEFKKIFIVEYNYDILKLAFQYYDYNYLFENKNIIFIDTTDDTKFIEMLADEIPLLDFKYIKPVKIDILLNAEVEKFKNALKMIGELYNFKMINVTTTIKFAREWQFHTFQNICKLNNTKNIIELKNIFNKMPIIIVAAGPSLENKIESLKKLKGKVIIAVVDTAAKILFDNGIIPDIISVADSQYLNYELVRNLNLDRTFIITNLIVHPDLYKNNNSENIIVYNSGTPVLEWFKKIFQIEIGDLKTGGSVSTVLFSFAVYAGCNPIIFVGQDLSYPDMKFYSRGTLKENYLFSNINKFLTVENNFFTNYLNAEKFILEKDINNKLVKTTLVLKGYRDWLVYESKNFPDIEFINVSQSGILYENFKQLEINDIVERYKENNVNIREILNKINKSIRFDYYDLIDNYKKLLYDFNNLRDNIEPVINSFESNKESALPLNISINNLIKYYDNSPVKSFIDFDIQDYLLLYKSNDMEYLNKLFKRIYEETNFFISALSNLVNS